MKENPKKLINKNYTVRVAKSVEEVEVMRSIWREMQWHPNADIDFYLTILDSRSEILRPHVILLSSSGQPKAMVVGRIEEKKLYFKIGYKTIYSPKVRLLTIVYGGILGDQDDDIADAIILELIDCLDRGEADVVFFNHLRLDSHIYQRALTKPSFLCREHFPIANLHWEMSLPRTIDDFYKALSSKRRHELKRKDRKLIKAYSGNVIVRCIRERHLLDSMIEDIERIAKNTYQRGLGVGFIDNSEMRSRIYKASERGWLQAYILYVEGKPCAAWIGTLFGKIFFLDFTCYDPIFKKYEPGTLLFIKMIEDLCSKNIKKVDFGFGDAIYKRFFGNHNWKEASVYIFSPTCKGIKLNLMRTLIGILSRFTERTFNRSILLLKIKKHWRGLLIPR